MEREERISVLCKAIAGICVLVGFIALMPMISDFIEFSSYLAELRQGVPDYIWNDPRIQSAISEGYGRLARIPLTVAIPSFLIAVIVLGAGRAFRKDSSDTTQGKDRIVKQVKPLVVEQEKQSIVEQEKPSTVKQVKRSMIKQVKPITQ